MNLKIIITSPRGQGVEFKSHEISFSHNIHFSHLICLKFGPREKVLFNNKCKNHIQIYISHAPHVLHSGHLQKLVVIEPQNIYVMIHTNLDKA